MGEILIEAGRLSDGDLAAALNTQRRAGGRLGEILAAEQVVDPESVTGALAERLGIPSMRPEDRPTAVLTAGQAHMWEAIALDTPAQPDNAVTVGFADPSPSAIHSVERELGRRVKPRMVTRSHLTDMLMQVYGQTDADEAVRELRERAPGLSAYSRTLSRNQFALLCGLVVPTLVGLAIAPFLTALAWVASATTCFLVTTLFRLYVARQGWRPDSVIDPPADEIAHLDEKELPVYSVLLPMYREKPSTIAALFDALQRIEYPRHKLDGLLLIEADDSDTQKAIETQGRPEWLRIIRVPPGEPRTKPRAMAYGLRFARGSLLTIYDAEDQPDPLQLNKAAWAFSRDPSLSCVQAKLGYYNARQNLLTRWFTLEYDAWFAMILPGLHRIQAPILLGGTSNHFRTQVLRDCLGWDPYNVTEDADLGLRLARRGERVGMLDSITYEEANSKTHNWIKQRSRWVKGYIQTFLVHTRSPRELVLDLGPRNAALFLITVGGSTTICFIAPVFWILLGLWLIGQPAWVASLFPPALYYPSLVLFAFGNFTLVYLSLHGAVIRGHDDLAPHCLLMPLYWLLMSVASYVALFEFLRRPHHWYKTEHGLHFEEAPA